MMTPETSILHNLSGAEFETRNLPERLEAYIEALPATGIRHGINGARLSFRQLDGDWLSPHQETVAILTRPSAEGLAKPLANWLKYIARTTGLPGDVVAHSYSWHNRSIQTNTEPVETFTNLAREHLRSHGKSFATDTAMFISLSEIVWWNADIAVPGKINFVVPKQTSERIQNFAPLIGIFPATNAAESYLVGIDPYILRAVHIGLESGLPVKSGVAK